MPPKLSIPDDRTGRIRTKRIYSGACASDGRRILVDRLWPRGVSKDRARLDSWEKEIAPSDALRHWFHENPDGWEAFVKRYLAELAEKEPLSRQLAAEAKEGVVTLLFASRDEEHNNATVLRDHLLRLIETDTAGNA